jgi:hypothetical protein
MGVEGAGIFLVLGLALAVVVYSALTKRRFWLLGVVCLLVAGLAGFGGYYAAVETQSVGWTIGYAALALFSTGVATRQLLQGRTGRGS